MSFPDNLFAEWRVADRAASAMEASNSRAALAALTGIGLDPSTGQRLRAVAMRAVADDLFQIAMGLMNSRAESNAKA